MSEAYYELLARYNALHERCSNLQHRVDTHTANDSIRGALGRLNPDTADVANLEGILRGCNLRVVADVAIVDIPAGEGHLTCSVDEAVGYMEGSPAEYGNLFNRELPKEPTPQEKRAAEISTMPMDQFMRERKQPGFFEPRPEPPAE